MKVPVSLLLLFCCEYGGVAEVYTLKFSKPHPPVEQMIGHPETLTLGSNEVARVLYLASSSLYQAGTNYSSANFWLRVQVPYLTNQDYRTLEFDIGPHHLRNDGYPVIRGPATMLLWGDAPSGSRALCTVDVTKASSVNEAEVIPANTTAIVSVEQSTNLVDWLTAWTTGATNTHQNLFLRMKVERLP